MISDWSINRKFLIFSLKLPKGHEKFMRMLYGNYFFGNSYLEAHLYTLSGIKNKTQNNCVGNVNNC